MKRPKYFYGYNIVASSFVIQAIGIGTIHTFGVFFKPLLAEFGWSRAALSGSYSIATIISGSLSILVGRLNDKLGPRVLITIASFLGLGFILMSRLSSTWQLYLFYGVFVGIGLSSIDIVSISTLMRWFVRRRGMMTGIVKAGTGIGQLVIPLMASIFITVYGWRTSYIIIGIAVIVLLISIGQLLRRDPASMGLLPDGDKESQTASPNPAETGFYLHKSLRTRQFWTICLAYFATMFCLFTVVVHIVPHATDIGLSSTAAAGILSTIGGISVVGRLITGIAIDRIGNKLVMIICFILLISAFLWLQLAREPWMLSLFALVYAFAHGGLFTMMSPIVAEYFGLRSHGSLFGIVLFSSMLGGAIGPIVAGHIFDITESYRLAFWACTVVGTTALGLVLPLRKTKPDIKELLGKVTRG